MFGIPMVIQNISGKFISNIDLEIHKISCIIGNSGKDKEEIEEILLKKTDTRKVRIIPRDRINIPLKVSEVYNLYEKRFGKRSQFILSLLDLDENAKLEELSEFEKFKVELAQVAFGETELLIVENFMETFEEQLKNLAIKEIIKISNLLDFKILFFFSDLDYINVCDRIYVIYGGRLLEYSTNSSEFYHPYTLALKNSTLNIGKKGEKIEVNYIGEPAFRGCPFHDYCTFAKKDRKLFRTCVTSFPPKVIINRNEVYCWWYSSRE